MQIIKLKDFIETKDEIIISVLAPGLTKEDFKIEIERQNNCGYYVLNIASLKEACLNVGMIDYSYFLGHNIDDGKTIAKVENGVLTITIKKDIYRNEIVVQ